MLMHTGLSVNVLVPSLLGCWQAAPVHPFPLAFLLQLWVIAKPDCSCTWLSCTLPQKCCRGEEEMLCSLSWPLAVHCIGFKYLLCFVNLQRAAMWRVSLCLWSPDILCSCTLPPPEPGALREFWLFNPYQKDLNQLCTHDLLCLFNNTTIDDNCAYYGKINPLSLQVNWIYKYMQQHCHRAKLLNYLFL